MRVLCFGDSNTYGYDPRSFFGGRYGINNRWPDLLAAQTGWDVINQGLNGREIPQGYALHFLPPAELCLVMLGTNDLLQGSTASQAAARMETFLTALLPHYDRILLVAPPPMSRGVWVATEGLVEQSVRLAEEYKRLAERLNIPFVDTRKWNIELCFDGVHFTEGGHHAFARELWQILGEAD